MRGNLRPIMVVALRIESDDHCNLMNVTGSRSKEKTPLNSFFTSHIQLQATEYVT